MDAFIITPRAAEAAAAENEAAEEEEEAEVEADDELDVMNQPIDPVELEKFLQALYADEEEATAAAGGPPMGMSFTDLLTKPWDGFDIFGDVLNPSFVPGSSVAASTFGTHGPAAPGSCDFSTSDLVKRALQGS
jgi:hypothetical protein